MNTFEVQLDPVNYTEILQGGTFVVFDILSAQTVEVYFTETPGAGEHDLGSLLLGDPGAVDGNEVHSWPHDWDFSLIAVDQPNQFVWVRGNTSIRGVR